MLSPLMPMIRTDLGLNYTQVGVVLSAFAITGGISQLLGGWLADRFGPQVVVAIGVSGVAIAGLLIGLSESYTVLIVFLLLAAILGGGYHPASVTAISASVPPERPGSNIGTPPNRQHLQLLGGAATCCANCYCLGLAWLIYYVEYSHYPTRYRTLHHHGTTDTSPS